VPLHLPSTFPAFRKLTNSKHVQVAMLGQHGLAWPWESLHVEALAWFDHWLKGQDTGILEGPRFRYVLPGAEGWRTADTWPLPEVTHRSLKLCADGTLGDEEGASGSRTLMALGADTLIMSDSSELGTIDPQIWSHDQHGKEICHSVLSYLDAYRTHSEALQKNPDDPVARVMLGKLDPTTLRNFETIRDRARNFAEDQLKRKGRNFSQIASALLDTTRWPSHGQMIKWQDVKDLGLPVDYLQPQTERWQAYWELYCLLRLAVKDRQNIFESAYSSLILDQ